MTITGANPASKPRRAEAISNEMPTESATVIASDHQVERSDSSLSHSLRTTRANVRW
jgi:hypothetical protein